MIYLDNNATTFLDPRVLSEMEAVFSRKIGNPSSLHRCGQMGKALLAKSFKEVAAFFEVQTSEVVFTSGATEALNMLIRSAPKGSHIVASSLEHVAVMESLKFTGCEVAYLDPAPGQGTVDIGKIEKAVNARTTMIVVMAANNETGVITDLEPIASFAQKRGIALVVDGVAILGKGRWKIPKGVSAVCFSGHKIHGPPGVGVAIIRKSMKFHPLIVGGPQQHSLRGGTENLPGIVGFAKALSFLPESSEDIALLRDRFEKGIKTQLPDIHIHGFHQPRVCNTSNISFPGLDGETFLIHLDLAGICASYGSACSSGSLGLSRVLLNMGVTPELVRSSIRFSLSRFTTQEEVDRAVAIITEIAFKFHALAC